MKKLTKFAIEAFLINVILAIIVFFSIALIQVNNLQFYEGTLIMYDLFKVNLVLICIVVNLQLLVRFLRLIDIGY